MMNPKQLLFLLLLLCATAATAHDFVVDGIYYNITDATAKTVAVTYKGTYYEYSNEYTGNVTIPTNVAYDGITYTVTSIGYKAFYYNGDLTSVTIPGSVTSIENSAFYACSSLTSVTIPGSVTSIGNSAFYACSGLTSVTILGGVTSIGDYAFCHCSNLVNVTINNGVTSIGDYAFYDCAITSITIPDSVTSIGSHAFDGCKNLATLTISDGTTNIGYNAFNGTAWYDNQPDGVVYIKSILYGYKGTMPQNTNITVKAGTKSIVYNAFKDCSGLASVTIPSSLSSIGNDAFSGCSRLKEVYISDLSAWCKIDFSNETANPLYYARCLFINGEQMTELTIPGDITKIKNYAFHRCSITDVTIPSSVTSIGANAFSGCNGLTSVTIPNSVTTIGGRAFYNCDYLTNIVIGSGVTSIGDYAFGECYNLINVYINDLSAWCKIDFIYSRSNPLCYAKKLYLNGEKVTNLVIPNDITEIKEYAFNQCTGLTSITIPGTVRSIGYGAFDGCGSLKTIYNNSSLRITAGSSDNGSIAYYANAVITPSNSSAYSTIGDFVFSTVDDTPTLVAYIGDDAKVALPQNYNGKSYAVGEKAFYNNISLASITIPSIVTSVGDNAFAGCKSLKTIYNNSSLRITAGSSDNGSIAYYANAVITPSNSSTYSTIGDFVFSTVDGNPTLVAYIGSTGKVSLPQDFNGQNYTIGEDAFSNRTDITSIAIPNSVTGIENAAFSYCSKLKAIYIENIAAWCSIDFEGSSANPLSLGADLYLNSRLLTDIVVPNSISEIKKYTFFGSGITSITIPDSVTTIGEGAFWNCSKLTSATIGKSVTTIGKYAFENCTSLVCIELPNNVTSISNMAFYGCSSLASVTIPESVTVINNQAFQNCYKLKTIYNNSSLELTLGSTDNGYVAYYANAVIRPSDDIQGDFLFRTIDGAHTLTRYLGSDSIITLPISYNGEEYVLGNSAFADCATLTDVTIPNNIKTISKNAFSGCSSLKNITIPSSVTKIDSAAFNGCAALEEILIPSSVTTLGDYVFRGCSTLKSIEIPSSVETLPVAVFYECSSLESVNLSDLKITTIPSSAFYKCSKLKSIRIPSSVTLIDDYAFQYCASLSSISIPASVTSIGDWVFTRCSGLQSVIFEDGSTTLHLGDSRYSDGLGGGLFDEIPLKTVYIGRNLSYYIATQRYCGAPFCQFYGYSYSSLEKAIIGPLVTVVPDYLFQDCKNLKEVISHAPAMRFKSYARSFDPANVALYVPLGEKDAYENTGDWKKFSSINESITIGDFTYSFLSQKETSLSIVEYKGNSTDVQIPENVDILGQEYTVVEIANRVFYNKNYISSFEIPNTVYKISEGTLDGTAWCSNQADGAVYAGKVLYKYKGTMPLNTSIVVKEGTKGIAAGAFKDYRSGTLTKITIPASLRGIGEDAFSLSESNNSVSIKVSISDLSAWCNIDFGNNYANPLRLYGGLYLNEEEITELTIPSDVTDVKNYAFCGANFTKVTIPSSVASIGNYAFGSIGNLYIEDSEDVLPVGYDNYSSSGTGSCVLGSNRLKTLYLGRDLSYESASSYGYSPFYDCDSLTTVEVGGYVTEIGDNLFRDCARLANIVLGKKTTSIGSYALYGCAAVTSITIPSNVTNIGNYAFYECDNLKNIYVKSKTPATIGGNYTFYDQYYDTIYVPKGTKDVYKAADYWKNFQYMMEADFSLPGDVDDNGDVDIADVTAIIDVILNGNEEADGVAITTFSEWTSTNAGIGGSVSQNSYTLNVVDGGVLIFDWSVSSESGYDYLIVTIDGTEILKKSGEQSGSYEHIFTVAGTHTLLVEYTKDGSVNNGNDEVRVYNIKLASEPLGVGAQTFDEWISTNAGIGSSTSQNSYTLNAVDGGVLTFDWSVSSESGYDYLIVTLDDTEILKKSGEQSGSYEHTFTIAGTHTLLVEYTKDGSVNDGSDEGRIYNIKLTGVGVAENNSNCDIDGDCTVDVADVTSLVSIMMGTNNEPVVEKYSVEISAEGDEQNLSINAAVVDYPYSAVQFDVYLPEGVTVTGDITAKGDAAHQEQGNGAVRVVIFSPDNSCIAGESINLPINTTVLPEGSYPVEIRNIILSAPNCRKVVGGDCVGYITIKDSTGVEGVMSETGEEGAVVYDLHSRRVNELVKGRVYIRNGKKFLFKSIQETVSF